MDKKFYLIYGDEDYLCRHNRDKFINSMTTGKDDMNFSSFYGKNFDQNSFRDMAATLPFFADKRLILLEDTGLFTSSNTITEMLDTVPETTVILFVEKEIDKRNKLYKYIVKNGEVNEYSSLTEEQMLKFVTMQLSSAGKKMTINDIKYFLSVIDNSLNNVKNETDKLIAISGDREVVVAEDVDTITSKNVTSHIFKMLDEIAEKNIKGALKLYMELLELKESPMAVLYLLNRHFNLLLQIGSVAGRMNNMEIAKKAKVPPFAVNKYISQSKNFTYEKLKEKLNMCIEMEYEFKNGIVSDNVGLEMLIVKLAS